MTVEEEAEDVLKRTRGDFFNHVVIFWASQRARFRCRSADPRLQGGALTTFGRDFWISFFKADELMCTFSSPNSRIRGRDWREKKYKNN